jgi:predicted  nucleic acid-binding Zn-ribbon protein
MKKLFLALTAIALFISCKNENAKESVGDLTIVTKQNEKLKPEENANKSGIVADFDDKIAVPQEPQRDKIKEDQQLPQVKQDWDKKILKTANLNLEVKDYNAYNTSLRDKVKQFGGYIAQEEQSQSEYKIENTLTIKIPVDQFDNAVNSISESVKELNEKKITSEDVTTEVIDTRSRLEAKKQIRIRYLDLLKQAKNMEEILNVQSEINGIQEQIESAAGRMEYLQHSSSFSTIHLTYYQVLKEGAVNPDKPSFAARITNAFQFGWNWVGELSIGLVSLWPLFLVVLGIIIFYKRSRRPKPKQA